MLSYFTLAAAFVALAQAEPAPLTPATANVRVPLSVQDNAASHADSVVMCFQVGATCKVQWTADTTGVRQRSA
jgi:hypothetical protein